VKGAAKEEQPANRPPQKESPMLRGIWKVRELLFTLVRRDLIVRYQSSVLGFLWSFAKPLALVGIFQIAFKHILGVTARVPFSLHLLVGILAWAFLARCIGEGHWVILAHSNLIKKVKLPVEVFPATTVIGNLVNYALAMLVVFPIILIIMSRESGVSWLQAPVQLLLFALVTVLLVALAFALTLLVSAVHVFYRDVESVTEIVLQAWFYATPIVYPMDLLYKKAVGTGLNAFAKLGGADYARFVEILYWLNPMTPICIAYRRILLYRDPPGLEAPDQTVLLYLGVAACTTFILYMISQAIFRRCSRHFADEV
jgi:ABC-2 type transport system permease protein